MLTKSDFVLFQDCPLHLWARTHDQLTPLPKTAHDIHLSQQGYEVERWVKQFLQHKVDTQYPDASLSFQETLRSGDYEARIDALAHDKIHDTYDLYEVKSSSSLKKEHTYDVTFQYLVGQEHLQKVHKIYLVYLNKEYVREGDVEIEKLFVVEDMMEHVQKLCDEVKMAREEAAHIISSDSPPLDMHCYTPKTCPSKALCHPDLPEHPIYELYRASKKTYQALLSKGVRSIAGIDSSVKLTKHQSLQLASLHQDAPIIDVDGISEELPGLEYPLYFLDYESFNPAIPIFDAYSPYQHIVFQYSLHVLNESGGELQHFEYLAQDTTDPSQALVKSLVSVIGESGSIIVWNKHFEMKRNEELARLVPEHAPQLQAINERVYDLLDPFRKGYYTDYRFGGSFSIKAVLPVLVPQLTHASLDVSEGTEAMLTWRALVHGEDADATAEEKEKIRKDLLEYCKLDTLAMVKIWEELVKAVK